MPYRHKGSIFTPVVRINSHYKGGRKNTNRAGEKKVQVLTLKGRFESREGDLFHFYASLKQKVTMLGTWFHFMQS